MIGHFNKGFNIAPGRENRDRTGTPTDRERENDSFAVILSTRFKYGRQCRYLRTSRFRCTLVRFVVVVPELGPLHTNTFSFENAYISMRLGFSPTLTR